MNRWGPQQQCCSVECWLTFWFCVGHKETFRQLCLWDVLSLTSHTLFFRNALHAIKYLSPSTCSAGLPLVWTERGGAVHKVHRLISILWHVFWTTRVTAVGLLNINTGLQQNISFHIVDSYSHLTNTCFALWLNLAGLLSRRHLPLWTFCFITVWFDLNRLSADHQLNKFS